MNDAPAELTAAEVVTGIPVVLAAALIVTACAVDAAGWPIDPASMLVLLALEALVVAGWSRGARRGPWVQLDGPGLAGCAVVVLGLFTYVLWLARPSFLPLNQSPDMIHHVSLVDFIRQRHSLVHDPSLWLYLGEFANYPPGSHVLAALAAAWAGTTGLHVLHPLLALLVAVKAGIVYNVILRLLPPPGRNPAIAMAGTLFLLFGWGYFLLSFIGQYYYAQVVAETFAVAMLWALVVWDESPSAGSVAFFVLCGVAVWLTWPVWLPVPLAALIGLILIRHDISLPDKVRWLAASAGPLLAVGVLYVVGRRGAASGILKAEGTVLAPSVVLYGRPLLALVVLGLALSLRRRRALPLLLFTGAAVAQTAALFAFDAYHHVTSYYLAYKMFHLLLYPMVLFAAHALDALWHLAERWWPAIRVGRRAALTVVVPVVVLGMAIRRDLPSRPYSAISEPVYEAGVWAKAHLPNGCVDYLVDHWATAYWLHVDVLGNPRAARRADGITHDFAARQISPARWTNPDRLPFAIVSNVSAVPADVRARFTILHEAGPSAVVQRSDGVACRDNTVPLDRIRVAARERTLARLLSSWLHKQ